MKRQLHKLLCFFGFHHHIELIDEVATKEWFEFCPAAFKPTPCTYLKCVHCGHEFFARTVGISVVINEKKT